MLVQMVLATGGTGLVALASGGVATYFLRTKFEFGLMGLLRFFLHPKHFSALAEDRRPMPYPGRRRQLSERHR